METPTGASGSGQSGWVDDSEETRSRPSDTVPLGHPADSAAPADGNGRARPAAGDSSDDAVLTVERVADVRAAGQGAAERVDTSFDRYARMVRRAVGAPVALVSVLEADRQVFLATVGLPDQLKHLDDTPLSHSFCQHVVASSGPLVVADARAPEADERIRGNLAIEDLGVVAYAGFPLLDHTGVTIGSVCAIDTQPREWGEEDLEALEDLAAACSAELAQRQLRDVAVQRASRSAAMSRRSRLLLELSERLASTCTLADVAEAVGEIAHSELGCRHAGLWLRTMADPTDAPLPEVSPVGGHAEPLTFVPSPAAHWSGAQAKPTLPLSIDNPAGVAVLTDELVLFNTREALVRRFPQFEGSDGQTQAFSPLVTAEQVLGVVALVWPDVRQFDHEDRDTLTMLTTYTAQAVQRALLLQERIEVALTLQNAMLTQLPQPDQLRLVARYLPAGTRDQVGGDWYDAVATPDGAINLMVGDVIGHNIEAAAVMGQLRSMLRAFAWDHPDETGTPARNLERLDRAARDLDLGSLATLIYARIEPNDTAPNGNDSISSGPARPTRTFRWTNAGHLPPLLVHVDGTATLLETPVDPMLGVLPETERRDHTATLSVGSTLVIFTDGLVERRGEHLTDDLERARATAARHAGAPVDDLVDGLLNDLTTTAGLNDDVAVLAVRFNSERA